MTQPTHIPKGGRCAACKHRDTGCKWENFESNPLSQRNDEFILKCTAFKGREDDEA